jgi:excisionase family DNA binding protein
VSPAVNDVAPDGQSSTPRGAPVVQNLVRVPAVGEGFLTVREVATRLRVSTKTVYKIIDQRRLPHVRVGNSVRISVADLV